MYQRLESVFLNIDELMATEWASTQTPLFLKIDAIAREVRSKLDPGNKHRPFGGLTLTFEGAISFSCIGFVIPD